MEIKKSTIISVFDSLGNQMIEGCEYIFDTSDHCFSGVYRGLSKKGALVFHSSIADSSVVMNVMPRSIVKIVRVDFLFNEGGLNNG